MDYSKNRKDDRNEKDNCIAAGTLCVHRFVRLRQYGQLQGQFRKQVQKNKLDDDDLEGYAELLDIDVDDYDVKSAIEATNKKDGTSVVIIECSSKAKAADLAEDAEEIVDLLEDYYGSSYSFGIETKGRFVLFGEEGAIEDALEK